MERLKRELPDLADHLNVPDLTAITNFFLIKSVVTRKDEKQDGDVKLDGEEVGTEGKTAEAVGGAAGGNVEGEKAVKVLPHLKDLDR